MNRKGFSKVFNSKLLFHKVKAKSHYISVNKRRLKTIDL
jgi:hypothetical protein